jgi:hypothetical protein
MAHAGTIHHCSIRSSGPRDPRPPRAGIYQSGKPPFLLEPGLEVHADTRVNRSLDRPDLGPPSHCCFSLTGSTSSPEQVSLSLRTSLILSVTHTGSISCKKNRGLLRRLCEIVRLDSWKLPKGEVLALEPAQNHLRSHRVRFCGAYSPEWGARLA